MTALTLWVCDKTVSAYGTCANRVVVGTQAANHWHDAGNGRHLCPDHSPRRNR